MTEAQHTLFLAAPRGFCAGVDRAIDIVELALEVYGRPVYVRHEIVHNRHVVEDLRAEGRGVRRRSRRRAGRRGGDLLGARRVAGGAARSAGARAPVARRHLPAGDQGASRGAALRQAGLHHRPDRPSRPRRGRGHDGRGAGLDRAGRDGRGRRDGSSCPIPSRVAYITQTTLSVDDVRAIVEVAQAPLPEHPRARQGRHLLRDPEPPERGEGAGAALSRRARGRRAGEQQRQPPGRGRRGARRARLPDRVRRGHPARVDRGRRRHHRRRLDARGRGAGVRRARAAGAATIGSRSSGWSRSA